MVRAADTQQKQQKKECANDRFMEMYEELHSRARRLAHRYPKKMRQAVIDDVLVFTYLTHHSAYHRGERPTAANLGYYAMHHLRHRSDVTRQYHQRRSGRDHYIESTDHGDVVPELGRILTAESMRDPAYQTQINLDWDRFAGQQDHRCRKILTGIARGDRKGQIAASICVSNGRLSQILCSLARDISAFFEGDLPLNSQPKPV